MHSFDPRHWWWPEDDGGGRGRRLEDPNLDRVLAFGVVAAACLCLASFAPTEVMPLLAANLLRLAALASVYEAVLRDQKPFEEQLTAWDQAAALLAGSMLLRILFAAPLELPADDVVQ
jgi:hypothetical protein